MFRFRFVPILVLLSTGTFCQEKLDFEQMYYDAEYLQQNSQFEESLPLYLKLIKNGKDNGNIQFKTGYTYLQISGLKHRAVPFLEKASESASKKLKFKKETSFKETRAPMETHLLLGEAYQANNELNKALEKYLYFKEITKDSDRKTNLVERKITSCHYAMEMIKFSSNIDFEIFINPDLNESSFNAAISGDGNSICFNVKRKHYNAIYFTRKFAGKWLTPKNITMEVESDGSSLVSGFSYDGKILLLSHANKNGFDIFKSTFSNIGWTKATALNRNINSMYNEIHAVLSPNGKTLYFVSDKSGGQGGFDIYKSVADQEGNWSTATSLGSKINTPYNENTPFLSRDGKILYFSSDGHTTMGGYDILFSKLLEDGEWSNPENLRTPINTTDDDLFFAPVNGDTLGIISRFDTIPKLHRSIYIIAEFPQPASKTIEKKVKGTIIFPESEKYHDRNIDIILIDESGTEIKRQTISTKEKKFNFSLPPGNYTVEASGEEIISESVSFKVNENDEILINLKIDLSKPEMITFSIGTIYFSFNQSNLDQNSIVILNEITEAMRFYPSLKLIITGYTDSNGSISYNQRLSLERAKVVKDFLSNHNISEERVEIIAKGVNNPVANNKDADGTDNPKGRMLNRRVTFSFSGPGSENILLQNTPIPDKF